MKYLSTIFAVLIFIFSIVPCSDAIGSHNNHTELVQEHENHMHNDAEDSCTPFCVCECCSISIIDISFITSLEEKIDFIFSYNFSYSLDYSFEYTHNVWNPPKS